MNSSLHTSLSNPSLSYIEKYTGFRLHVPPILRKSLHTRVAFNHNSLVHVHHHMNTKSKLVLSHRVSPGDGLLRAEQHCKVSPDPWLSDSLALSAARSHAQLHLSPRYPLYLHALRWPAPVVPHGAPADLRLECCLLSRVHPRTRTLLFSGSEPFRRLVHRRGLQPPVNTIRHRRSSFFITRAQAKAN